MKPKRFAKLVLDINKARGSLIRCSRTANHRPDIHHEWGDTDCDWGGLNAAAALIQRICWKYGRFFGQTKEKYGTVRCSPCITRIENRVLRVLFGRMLARYQEYILKRAYKQALKKYPHLALEILRNQPFENGALQEYDLYFYKKKHKNYVQHCVRKGMMEPRQGNNE